MHNSLLTTRTPDTERIERFQSLQAGQYWRARSAVPAEGIEEGMVLLLESIRWADDRPHTIILRTHPTRYGVKIDAVRDDGNGGQWKFSKAFTGHRFLLDDFLAMFEFEPRHQEVRSAEMTAAQKRISALQAEIVEAQTNPQKMAQVVNEALLAKRQEQARLSDNSAGDQTVTGLSAFPSNPSSPTPSPSHFLTYSQGKRSDLLMADALQAGLDEARVQSMRNAAEVEYQVAAIKAEWIQSKSTAVAEAIQAITPFYTEQAAAAIARTEEVRVSVGNLLKGIESLDLYVGKSVTVVPVCEGAPAPQEEPLTFVQKKLLMDEELAVWADVDEDFDFDSAPAFFDALSKHPELVDQVFPTQRCVLVMATTRRLIDYGDSLTNIIAGERNSSVFLLVRNGQNIYQVFSPVESHLRSHRLFPTKSEQDQHFRGIRGETMRFEDVAYTDRLSEHDAAALHYKRFLILACGLDHRLKLFGDFYPSQSCPYFVSLEFQELYCRFLFDDEGGSLLEEAARPSIYEWLKTKNAHLTSGSRVLGNWSAVMDGRTAPAACTDDREDRVIFRYRPTRPVDLAIAYRDKDAICVDVEVSNRTHYGEQARTFNCKVNLSRHEPRGQIGFLCMDTVTEDELLWYIRHRQSRQDHIFYIRFFKLALNYLRAEKESESDTRAWLAKAIKEGKIAAEEQIPELIDQAVVAWRAANRGKPLPKVDGTSAKKEVENLMNQIYRLARTGDEQIRDAEHFALTQCVQPLRLALDGKSGKLVLYAAPSAQERDDRLLPHVWVHRYVLAESRGGLKIRSHRWDLLALTNTSDSVLHDWPAAEEWGRTPDFKHPFLSPAHKADVFAACELARERLEQYLAPSAGVYEQMVSQWIETRQRHNVRSKLVADPELAFPVGLVMFGSRVHLLTAVCTQPHALLASLAPSAEHVEKVKVAYVRPFANKKSAATRFDSSVSHAAFWELKLGRLPSPRELSAPFDPYVAEYSLSRLQEDSAVNPLLSAHLDRWLKASKWQVRSAWLSPSLEDGNGNLVLDELLGLALPSDYAPTTLFWINAYNESKEKWAWIDLAPFGQDASNVPPAELGSAPNRSYTPHHFMTPARALAWAECKTKADGLVLREVEAPEEGYRRFMLDLGERSAA